MERVPTELYLWISRLAIFVGILCILIALVTALADTTVMALSRTYVQIASAAFLFAIWFVVLALLHELRERETKSR